MDCGRIGSLILKLRKEKGLTQRELADLMGISDKAVSKWERGLGCPDVSLIAELADKLGVNTETILKGALLPNVAERGNMMRIKFYVCPDCGGILTSTGNAEVSCCGRKLDALIPKQADDAHTLTVETVECDLYVTFPH